MEEDFRLGEKTTTPFRKTSTKSLEFMEQNVIGLQVSNRRIPRVLHNLIEPRQLEPKVFEPKGSRLIWPGVVGEEQGTMV